MDPEVEKLIVLNLKYSNRERTLNRYVFADFSLKALFQLTHLKSKAERAKPVPLADIYKMLAKLVGLKNLPRKTVMESLDLLKADKKITGSNATGWILLESTYTDVIKKLRNESAFTEEVLKRHFPHDIKDSTLKKWFYDISAKLFSKFGDTVVANISRGGADRFEVFNLTKLIDETAKAYRLTNKKTALLRGYENFINSTHQDDQKLIMDLAIRWFGARLVVANVGHDPITIEEIKGSKFVLDTNVLIAIALGRKPFTKSIKALSKALKEIGAELVYLPGTREQYIHVADYQSDQVIQLLRSYGLEKIKSIGPEEDFVKASITAGCKDEDDFRKYFQEIRDLPTRLQGGPAIRIEEDDQIIQRIEAAEKDTVLIDLIRKTKVELTGTEPTLPSLKHDAALMRVTEFLAEDEHRKVWTLTFDNGLKYAGIKSAGSDTPKVMGVETLIEFLALSTAGLNISSEDFAPLLASILKNHCLPYGGTRIRLSDLLKLQATIKEAPKLPVENIRRMGHIIAKARLENRPVENVEVQAELASLQNKEFEHYDRKLQRAEERAADADSKRRHAELATGQEKKLREKIETSAIKDRAFRLRLNLILVFAWSLIYRAVIITIFYYVVAAHFSHHLIAHDASVFQVATGLLSLSGFVAWAAKPFQTLNDGLKEADKKASAAIKQLP